MPGVALRYEDVGQQAVATSHVDEAAWGARPSAPGFRVCCCRVDGGIGRRDGLGTVGVFPEEHEKSRDADVLDVAA